MPRYAVVPDRSHIWIDARSSLHPIHVEAAGLEGFLDVDVAPDGSLDLTDGCSGHLEVPVDALRSGIAIVDREAERRLESRRYPRILARLERLVAGPQDGRYGATGSITVRDRTQRYSGELSVVIEDAGTLRVTGERTFDIRTLGLEPPRLLLLKMQPEVAVRVNVLAVDPTWTNGLPRAGSGESQKASRGT